MHTDYDQSLILVFFRSDLPVEGRAPSLDGAVEWLNSPPLTNEQLRGKVVLVDFWTYSLYFSGQ
ncbi:MAG: hypothetical protein EAS49_09420, partial [Brucella intermedia]